MDTFACCLTDQSSKKEIICIWFFSYFNLMLLFNTHINYNIRRSTMIAYVASRALLLRTIFFFSLLLSLHSRITTIRMPEFGKHFFFVVYVFSFKEAFFFCFLWYVLSFVRHETFSTSLTKWSGILIVKSNFRSTQFLSCLPLYEWRQR